jgi:RNA polymerase sigma factor (sigma-70 family)
MGTGHGDPEELVEVALDVLDGAADPSDTDLAEVEPSGPATVTREGRQAGREARPDPGTLGSYLAEIGRVPLLSAAEEVGLGRLVQDGLAARAVLHSVTEPGHGVALEDEAGLRRAAAAGRVAAERLTEANLRLVVSIAKRYANSDVPLMDVVQDGNLGLMRAVEKFDPERGFKFSTYATWWIRQACSRGLVRRRQMRLPDQVHWQVLRLRRAERELTGPSGAPPSDEQLAQEVGLTVEQVTDLRSLPTEPVSLDLPVNEDGQATLADLLSDNQAPSTADQVVTAQLPVALRGILATLPDRQRHVLELRFGLGDHQPHTLEEIARAFGVTRARVQQLESTALARLRHHRDTRDLHYG